MRIVNLGGLAAKDRASMPRDVDGAKDETSLAASADLWERVNRGPSVSVNILYLLTVGS